VPTVLNYLVEAAKDLLRKRPRVVLAEQGGAPAHWRPRLLQSGDPARALANLKTVPQN
jgi:hypothetical protein